MGPSEHLTSLLRRLSAGSIDWSRALNIAKAMPRAWQTDEWRRTRNSRIQEMGGLCGVCCATQGLVLQHTWHPRFFYPLLELVADEVLHEYKQKYPPPATELLTQRDAYYARRAHRDQMLHDWRDRIFGEATRRSLLESLRYLEMRPEDTCIRCKACAYNEDATAGLTHAHR
jgi:hypothetical protein